MRMSECSLVTQEIVVLNFNMTQVDVDFDLEILTSLNIFLVGSEISL